MISGCYYTVLLFITKNCIYYKWNIPKYVDRMVKTMEFEVILPSRKVCVDQLLFARYCVMWWRYADGQNNRHQLYSMVKFAK